MGSFQGHIAHALGLGGVGIVYLLEVLVRILVEIVQAVLAAKPYQPVGSAFLLIYEVLGSAHIAPQLIA
jgi:hypothetical protein